MISTCWVWPCSTPSSHRAKAESLLRPLRRPLPVPSAISEISAHRIPFDAPSKRQYVPRLRMKLNVMDVDRSFNSARLVRSFEMSTQLRPVLLDFHILRGSSPIGILRINRPLPCHIIRRSFWWRLLCHSQTANKHIQQRYKNYTRFHPTQPRAQSHSSSLSKFLNINPVQGSLYSHRHNSFQLSRK
jgi:hypothetical protein